MGVRVRASDSLRAAWTKKVQGMKRMKDEVKVEPEDPFQVIRLDEQATRGRAKLDCGPAVFELVERAHGKRRMYVVVKGSICVQESSPRARSFQTVRFATKVGYFRFKRRELQHVYGVHYDMDEQSDGHPVFHAQMGPAMEFASEIQKRFHVGAEVHDRVRHVLRNVRTPSAQMDFFSVFTQLCADHLISNRTNGEDQQVTAAFDVVRKACGCLQGAAHRLSHLNSGKAPQCYRSSHWYGRP